MIEAIAIAGLGLMFGLALGHKAGSVSTQDEYESQLNRLHGRYLRANQRVNVLEMQTTELQYENARLTGEPPETELDGNNRFLLDCNDDAEDPAYSDIRYP